MCSSDPLLSNARNDKITLALLLIQHHHRHFLAQFLPTMSNEKAIVYAEDMTDEMMNEAIKTAKNAFQSSSNRVSGGPYKETAAMIRSHFDKQYGPHWNCIVGRSFGSYVTHEIKTYIYFSVKAHVAVLLWKT